MQLLHAAGFSLISGTLMAQTSDSSAEASSKFAKLSDIVHAQLGELCIPRHFPSSLWGFMPHRWSKKVS